jgi:hypothetical protein
MKQFDDDSAQLSSLTELCELLSISTEESLSAFPVEQVVPLLVSVTSVMTAGAFSEVGCCNLNLTTIAATCVESRVLIVGLATATHLMMF